MKDPANEILVNEKVNRTPNNEMQLTSKSFQTESVVGPCNWEIEFFERCSDINSGIAVKDLKTEKEDTIYDDLYPQKYEEDETVVPVKFGNVEKHDCSNSKGMKSKITGRPRVTKSLVRKVARHQCDLCQRNYKDLSSLKHHQTVKHGRNNSKIPFRYSVLKV